MATHPIVHIEIPATDPKAASTFYREAFGWEIQVDNTLDYHMFRAEGGPGGGFVGVSASGNDPMRYKIDSPLLYIGTDDIEASLRKVEELGGTTVMPKHEIPQTGWFAIFTDPQGNHIALYTPLQQG